MGPLSQWALRLRPSADGPAHAQTPPGVPAESIDHEVDLPLSASGSWRPRLTDAAADQILCGGYTLDELNEERARASSLRALTDQSLRTPAGHRRRLGAPADADIVVDLREDPHRPEGPRGTLGRDVRVDELVAGDLLPGWYDEWVVAEREHFRQLRLHALEELCEELTDEGGFGEAWRPAWSPYPGSRFGRAPTGC